MTKELNEDPYGAIWAEIELLRQQLQQLMIARETLARHHAELTVLKENLEATADKTKRMADEVAELLEGE